MWGLFNQLSKMLFQFKFASCPSKEEIKPFQKFSTRSNGRHTVGNTTDTDSTQGHASPADV
jgi:hypothetical protein